MSPKPFGKIKLEEFRPSPTNGVTGRYEFKSPAYPIKLVNKTIYHYTDFDITVKVDVEGQYPQNVISVLLDKRFNADPEWDYRRTEVIATVIADTGFVSTGKLFGRTREITARVDYRVGVMAYGLDKQVVPEGSLIKFKATQSYVPRYVFYRIEFNPVFQQQIYPLNFVSDSFEQFKIEVDQVVDAGAPVLEYDLASHPNRPLSLPVEKLTLASVFQAAGFDTKVIRSPGVIPLTDAKADGLWSDTELHNAMVNHSSIHQNAPQMAAWLLFARQHKYGPNYAGMMFDDIGPQQRQGAAVFTDSFIKNAPPGEPHPEEWKKRLLFTTAIHEIGHCFNLFDSADKTAQSIPWEGSSISPWRTLRNDSEARSFMNYPWRVTGGVDRFFSDFRFRFIDPELLFMRHAPRNFVTMGGLSLGSRHAAVLQDEHDRELPVSLQLRPNRSRGVYQFLEPIVMELKLTNTGDSPIDVDPQDIQSEDRVHFLVQRDGGTARRWAPFATRLIQESATSLNPGESVYGSHSVSLSPRGWLMDEPGFYWIQGGVSINGLTLYSNPQRILITPPTSNHEAQLALDWFSPDVARVLAFNGCPALAKAQGVLAELLDRAPGHAASIHAGVSLQTPGLRPFKDLVSPTPDAGRAIRVAAPREGAMSAQRQTLFAQARQAARTLGHIRFVALAHDLANSLHETGDLAGAVEVLDQVVGVMRERRIATPVIDRTLKLAQGWREQK